MKIIGILTDWMKSVRGIASSDWAMEFDFVQTESERLYLKKLAIDCVLNYVSRTMSTATFKIKNENFRNCKEWDYLLNVRPNLDMSATMFWQQVFYRLLFDNEVLVIITKDNQLLIADEFVRKEGASREDVFENVKTKNRIFDEVFRMSDVFYLEYNNSSLEELTQGVFRDYSELFGRMIEVAMRNNQIRASVSVEATGSLNDKKGNEGRTRSQILQEFIDKIYDSFKTNSVAIVPKIKGFEYEEYSNKVQSSNQSIEELLKLKKSLIDDVARIVGVPSALVHGELAELEHNIKAYRRTCVKQLVKKLQDEINAKVFSKPEYIQGNRIEVRGVLPYDPTEQADNVSKIVSSGAFYPDEVRQIFEYDDLPNGEGKRLVMTKNYEEVKGGGRRMSRKNIPYEFLNEKKEGKYIITLSGTIRRRYWDGDKCIDAELLRDAMSGIEDDVIIRLNSNGGDVFEGMEMYNYIKDHPSHITVEVTGIAASAATFVLMGADKAAMNVGSTIMIHEAETLAWGNKADLKKRIDALETIDQSITDIYVAKTGQPVEQIVEWVDQAKWFTADEAVEYGFADEVKKEADVHGPDGLNIHDLVGQAVADAMSKYQGQAFKNEEKKSLLSKLRKGE